MSLPASRPGCFLSIVAALCINIIAAKAAFSKLGCEFAGVPFTYTNIANGCRQWALASDFSKPAPIDANGWPTSDVFTVVFDLRPAFAWAPPEDDPWGWQPPVNGTYFFKFRGSGRFLNNILSPCLIENISYPFKEAF